MQSAVLITPTPDNQADLFQGLSPKERADNLEALAHLIDEESYRKPLTTEELTIRKDNLVNNSVELNLLAEEKRAITAELNGKAKRLNQLNRSLLDDITYESVEAKGKVYSILSEEGKWVDRYNEDGVWLARRRAAAADAQGHISMRINS